MYLGIDIGTSSVKVVLIDADQRIVAIAQRAARASSARIRAGRSRTRRAGRGDLRAVRRRALPRPPGTS